MSSEDGDYNRLSGLIFEDIILPEALGQKFWIMFSCHC